MKYNTWPGYDRVLGNGNNGSRVNLEKFFERGVIGKTNTSTLYIREVFDRNKFVADENGKPMEDPPKVIYAHPSETIYPSGTRLSVSYSGGSVGRRHNKRKVADSAILVVDEEPLLTGKGLEDVRTFLAGDSEDDNLENRGISIQGHLFTA